MLFKFLNYLTILCFLNFFGLSQNITNSNFLFIKHLTESDKNREALFLLDNTKELTNSDSTNYLKGMNYYYLRKPDSASNCFKLVQPSSNFYTAAKFFEALNMGYAKKNIDAVGNFSKFSADTLKSYKQLIVTVQACDFLIQRNYKRFDSLSEEFLFNDYKYSNEQRHIIELRKESANTKKKSPFVAGALSAIIPGLGKFYAGKRGAGLAAFAVNSALGAMVLESYYRTKNFKSPQFITFTTLFGFFYVGNIFGSVFSIKQQIKSVNGRINNEILASIHVPIIRFFK